MRGRHGMSLRMPNLSLFPGLTRQVAPKTTNITPITLNIVPATNRKSMDSKRCDSFEPNMLSSFEHGGS